MRIKILKAVMATVGVMTAVSAMALDSESVVPLILFALCLGFWMLIIAANADMEVEP